MTIEELKEKITRNFPDMEVLVFENPDYADAFVGISDDYRAIYDYKKMVECLELQDKMSYEEAAEFIGYNTMRALPYMGADAPIIILPMED